MAKLDSNILKFIADAPLIDLDPKDIKEIQSDTFDNMKEKLEEKMEELKRDNDKMREAMIHQKRGI